MESNFLTYQIVFGACLLMRGMAWTIGLVVVVVEWAFAAEEPLGTKAFCSHGTREIIVEE
jgi:hypothetical protein